MFLKCGESLHPNWIVLCHKIHLFFASPSLHAHLFSLHAYLLHDTNHSYFSTTQPRFVFFPILIKSTYQNQKNIFLKYYVLTLLLFNKSNNKQIISFFDFLFIYFANLEFKLPKPYTHWQEPVF